MKSYHSAWILLIFTALLPSCSSKNEQFILNSPDGRISLEFKTVKGQMFYSVRKDSTDILLPSRLGFILKDSPELGNNMNVTGTAARSYSETWEQPWGERRLVENKYDELRVDLEEKSRPSRKLSIIFRAFNDGIGFRYLIPRKPGLDTFLIQDELTGFRLPEDDSAWGIPAYKDRFYESLYRLMPVSELDTVHTPLTIQTVHGKWVTIHEANLTNYSSMNLYCAEGSSLKTDLTPWSTGEKVRAATPMESPWRIIIIADKPGDLIASTLMLNLNEPSRIKDCSWIKPGRYIGIWWAMHQNKYTWSQGPHHGATTANAMRYIDFAAANHFSGVLVEGWNKGWDGDWTVHGDSFSFTEAYPDFDIKKITDYAALKSVKLIGHNETGGASKNYEKQLDDAFRFYNKYGVDVVKTGYVSNLLDGKERHGSQYGVLHYRKVIETAAKYHIMIDNHEPVVPTGLQRTWPNFMTSEGVRGQEWDAWSTDGGNPPEHTTIIPFTRGLAGPMDFTPGTFNFSNPVHPQTRVRTTLAKQLAMYVILYSPLQMASDLPENYTNKKAFSFITQVPVNWEDTRVIDSRIGDYVIIARKDRDSDDWFLGAITDEKPRILTIDLSFLGLAPKYQAKIWADGDKANWESNPADFRYEEKRVDPSEKMELRLAAGGGQAIRFSAVKD